ncbi:hypothetical protein [Virgibacillus salexigens]|uniref:hypothetical protein n=1 Tax=Virgibacillus salexigens TaxID=61016 RepID=UPI0030812119
MEILITIILIITIFASIAAWLNTKVILKELELIKDKLEITDREESSFLKNDLDS